MGIKINKSRGKQPRGPDKILGRLRELKILKNLVVSNKAKFIAIYGHHRVGKTYLIKNFADSISCVYFHVTGLQKGSLSEQLEEFANQLGKTFYQGAQIVPIFCTTNLPRHTTIHLIKLT